MSKKDKPIELKKKKPIVTWALSIVIIFFVCVAIYILFNRKYEVVDFPDLKKPTYTEEEQAHIEHSDKKPIAHYQSSCYEGSYINNLYLFLDLYMDFYKGSNIRDQIAVLHETNLYDKYLDQVVQYLTDLTKNDVSLSEQNIKNNFVVIKKEVLRVYAKDKLKDSSLLRSLFNALTFYKKGQAALDAGGVERLMENAQQAISQNKIDKAYDLLLSLQEPEYTQIINPWLIEVGYFIRVKEVLEDTKKYVFSERYSNKFLKTCEKENV